MLDISTAENFTAKADNGSVYVGRNGLSFEETTHTYTIGGNAEIEGGASNLSVAYIGIGDDVSSPIDNLIMDVTGDLGVKGGNGKFSTALLIARQSQEINANNLNLTSGSETGANAIMKSGMTQTIDVVNDINLTGGSGENAVTMIEVYATSSESTGEDQRMQTASQNIMAGQDITLQSNQSATSIWLDHSCRRYHISAGATGQFCIYSTGWHLTDRVLQLRQLHNLICSGCSPHCSTDHTCFTQSSAPGYSCPATER